jgi:hypothetical protein
MQKKIAIKIIRIKTEIILFIYFLRRGKIEKKNQINKRIQKKKNNKKERGLKLK